MPTEPPQPNPPPQLLPHWDKLLPALVVVLAISIASVWAMDALGGAQHVRGWVENAGIWGPLVFVLLKASTYVIAPLSGTPLKITAGALFGVWEGLAYTMLGDILGGSLNFWIARQLGRPAIARVAGKGAIKQVDDAVAHVGGWKALLVARLVLSALYDFISYAAGLSKLPYRQYLWVTIVGGIPGSLMYVWLGNSLTSGPYGIGIMAGLLGLALLAAWAQKRIKQ
jgi:uncharacterized membrane protein YdjX (TVP38/TMEM64 family)